MKRIARVRWLVNVAKPFAIRREREPSEVSSRKNIRKRLFGFDVEYFKRPGSFAALFHFVEQKVPITRYKKRFHRRVVSRLPAARVDEKTIFAVGAIAHINAWLFLLGKMLTKEVAARRHSQ